VSHHTLHLPFGQQMQSIGDLENAYIMFDHFKHKNGWTTMVCHNYDLTCCEVLTNLFYDVQSKSNETQCVLWTKLNKIMFKHDLSNTNFKGFMVNLMCRWIGMMTKLFMGQKLFIWLGKNIIAYFIRLYHLIDTPSSWSHINSKTNIRHCAINIRIPLLWNRSMCDVLQFDASGLPVGLPLK
jgi:hypothetical protein